MSGRSRKQRQIKVDLSGLGPDPFGELALFRTAATVEELDRILRQQVSITTELFLDACQDCDAFDIIELLRLREFPIAPVAALEPGYDGSAAIIELVSLVLLTRGQRMVGARPREDTRPHELVPDLHDRAGRLIRLAAFRTQAAAYVRGGDAVARLSADYQSYFVGVRGMRYESVQETHDQALFDRPEIGRLLRHHLGFTYTEFVVVRDAIQDRYSSAMNRRRDTVAALMTASESERRELTSDEGDEFRTAMIELMFLPAERASFSAHEISTISDLALDTVEAVLAAFSIDFDNTRAAPDVIMDFLRGRNPLSRTCLMRSGDHHLMTSNQIGSDSFRAIVESALKALPKAWQRYDRSRTIVSESLSVRALERVLKAPALATNLKYLAPGLGIGSEFLSSDCATPLIGGVPVESDALFVLDDVAVCVEVKGRSIADAAKRGDLARLSTEVHNIMGSGAFQARRLEMLIRANGGVWREDGTWFDLSAVREVRTVVIGLDAFGPLSIGLGDLAETSMIGDGPFPWIASVHDLEVISKVIDRPAEFLLYLRRRTDSGVATYFRALDELDLFMLFMEGGLYVEPDPDEIRQTHSRATPTKSQSRKRHRADARPTFVGTHTDPLDAWMYWIEGSSLYEADKPVRNTHPTATRLVDFLADEHKPGWLRFGADLLALSGNAQKKLGLSIQQLVARTSTDGEIHTLFHSFAGLWGHPTLFVGTVPTEELTARSAAHLHAYMLAKKHQVQSDRSLGLLLDNQADIIAVAYLNNPPSADDRLDALGDAMALQVTWIPRTAAAKAPKPDRSQQNPASLQAWRGVTARADARLD